MIIKTIPARSGPYCLPPHKFQRIYKKLDILPNFVYIYVFKSIAFYWH